MTGTKNMTVVLTKGIVIYSLRMVIRCVYQEISIRNQRKLFSGLWNIQSPTNKDAECTNQHSKKCIFTRVGQVFKSQGFYI